jgi:hypothetical protein
MMTFRSNLQLRGTLGLTLTALWLLMTGAVGCSEETDTSPDPDPEPQDELEVRAQIGPDGGELLGEEGTELEGVRLVIPAGALEETVDVWIRPTFDAERLPELAERVGAQLEIGSDGDLLEDAALSLPFDGGLVDRFGQGESDVKVWVRDGDGWLLVEADDASATSVTIPLASFTTAAAGVRVVSQPVACGTSCDASADAHFDAGSCATTGACITRVVPEATSDSFNFAVTEVGRVGYLSPTSSIMVIAVSHELTAGAAVQGDVTTLSSSLRANFAFDKDGNLFAGLGSTGNVKFPAAGGKAQVFDAGLGLGALTLGDGTLLRLSRDKSNNLVIKDGTSNVVVNHEEQIVATLNGVAASLVPTSDKIGVIAVGATEVTGFLKVNDALNAYLNLPLPTGQSAGGQAPVAAGPNGEIAVVTQPGGKVALSREGAAFKLVTSVSFPASDVAFDPDGNLLITSGVTPEVAVLDTEDVATGIRLTDAASSSAEYTGRIPRVTDSFVSAMEFEFTIMTQDRTFLRLGLR